MRVATVLGKKIRLSEKEYSQLLCRFDLDLMKKGCILVSCPTCDKHNIRLSFECRRCTFRKFRNLIGEYENDEFYIDSVGCMALLKKVIGGSLPSLYVNKVCVSNNSQERTVKRIHRFLKTKFKKV